MKASPFLPDAALENHLASHVATHCPNCGTRIAGQFCQGCGQPAQLHVPSAREFLHEFIAHYVALEGKLWKSLALLLFRPGRLTRDYIDGKRARYVEPLRLYLSFSIIFFAIFKLSGIGFGNGTPESPQAQRPGASVAQQAGKTRDAAIAPAPRARDQDVVQFGKGDDEKAEEIAASVHPALGKKVAQFLRLPEQDRQDTLLRALSSYTPYAIFAVMPVFAAFLKLLYFRSGRRYGEHLLFALHSNAFAFLALSLWMLVPDFIPLVRFGLGVWLVFYLPTAMRKVYGGGRLVTALRWVVLLAMHLLSIVVAIAAVAALAVIA